MNYEANKSIKFTNGKLLVKTSETITTPNNNLIRKSTKIQYSKCSNSCNTLSDDCHATMVTKENLLNHLTQRYDNLQSKKI